MTDSVYLTSAPVTTGTGTLVLDRPRAVASIAVSGASSPQRFDADSWGVAVTGTGASRFIFARTHANRLLPVAQERISELERITAVPDECEVMAPFSNAAADAALGIVRAIERRWPAVDFVAIFALEDGGAALQVMGPTRTASVEIAPGASEMMRGKYVSQGAYHRQSLAGSDAAADFLAINAI